MIDPTITNITVFVLAVFVGYHVVWNVTPALHTPLMSVTNAVSGVIIVGAILAAGPAEIDFGSLMGVAAVALAAINVVGDSQSSCSVVSRCRDLFHPCAERLVLTRHVSSR
jgi:NAD(P) transhydrogenase subunit alpha